MIGSMGGASTGPVRFSMRHARWSVLAAVAAFAVILPLVAAAAPAGASQETTPYGPFGPEGPRLREQLWILPSADHGFPLRATVFRPAEAAGRESGEDRRPLVVINHGTSDATRLAVAMPVYYWLSRWFVEHGYVVVLPQRRGHGATGGPMAESIGTCADPDHIRSGLAAADDIQGAVDFMSAQPFVMPGEAIVVGISSGGWASLALASRNSGNVRAVINIAGGRGARPFGQRTDSVCGEKRLIEAASVLGRTARAATLWLYAANDSYFRPDLARALAAAWQTGGGEAELHVFPAYGSEGHNLADDHAGWDVWGGAIEKFLAENRSRTPVAAAEPLSVPVEPAAVAAPSPASTAASDGETRVP